MLVCKDIRGEARSSEFPDTVKKKNLKCHHKCLPVQFSTPAVQRIGTLLLAIHCFNKLNNIHLKGSPYRGGGGHPCITISTYVCVKEPNWTELCVLFALSWLPSSALKLTPKWCQPGVFLLPRCCLVQHARCVPSGLRAQI